MSLTPLKNVILHIFIYNVMSDFSSARRVSEVRVNNFTCCNLHFGGGGVGVVVNEQNLISE